MKGGTSAYATSGAPAKSSATRATFHDANSGSSSAIFVNSNATLTNLEFRLFSRGIAKVHRNDRRLRVYVSLAGAGKGAIRARTRRRFPAGIASDRDGRRSGDRGLQRRREAVRRPEHLPARARTHLSGADRRD